MGVKVTFLREADARPPPAARPVTLVPKSAIKTEQRRQLRLPRRGRTRSSAAPCKTGGTDGDRVEVVGRAVGAATASSSRRPTSLADGMPIVIK